jgi:tetratricopeptide (TPR) repeat protein
LVDAFTERGELNHMNGRTIDAEGDFRAAIGHLDKLRSLAMSASYQRAKASALINLSEVFALQNRHAEAHAVADQAVDLLQTLALSAPKTNRTSMYQWLLCLALTDRGVASREEGNLTAAKRDFDAAAQVADQVPPGDEVYVDVQFQRACVANQRGELLAKDLSRRSEADEDYERASRILTRLIQDHKVIPHHRAEMAATLLGRSGVRLAAGRIPEAEGDCRSALDHIKWLMGTQAGKVAPEDPRYLSLLGQILARQSQIHFVQGQASEGRKTLAEAMEKLNRAIAIDPARAADKVKLDQIKTDLSQFAKDATPR